MAAVTPQKLGSLSTSTLTAILELTRAQQLQVTPAPSLRPKISKNMSTLRSGIQDLSLDQVSPDMLTELCKQYGRLYDLATGLDIQAERIDVPQHQDERLIDDDSAFPLQTLQRDQPLIPHVSISMPEEDEEDAAHDEESMRRANSDVMMLQKRMMADQDETLNALSEAISRQRDLSLNISSELEVHNQLLEETDEALDHTQSRLQRAATQLERVGRRTARDNSATCIIVILVVVLMILVVIFR